jgi:hypothetical protein
VLEEDSKSAVCWLHGSCSTYLHFPAGVRLIVQMQLYFHGCIKFSRCSFKSEFLDVFLAHMPLVYAWNGSGDIKTLEVSSARELRNVRDG